MELSVRSPRCGGGPPAERGGTVSHGRAQPVVDRTVPVLRVWAVDRLLLHEEADAARVDRLVDALRRDGVLRNPPAVAPVADRRAVVLDGANRVSAVRALGLSHIVVQPVAYDDPEITLSAWRHFAAESVPGTLRAAAEAELGPLRVIRDGAEAERRLAAGEGIAAILDGGGTALVPGPAAGVAAAAALSRLTVLYRNGRPVHRIAGGSLDDLRAAYGTGALVLFRRFEKSEILGLAAQGGRLPAGITRHLVPGRALRLNTPLAWLAEPTDLAAKQAVLEAQLRQRWQAHGVRYYAEPTFLFDE
jgi:hypothetical protein